MSKAKFVHARDEKSHLSSNDNLPESIYFAL